MQIDETYKQFFLQDGTRIRCQPCLVISFFAPIIDNDSDLSAPLVAFLAKFQEQINWYRNDFNQMHAKRISKAGKDALFKDMHDELRNPTSGALIELHGGNHKDEWILPSYQHSSVRPPSSRMNITIKISLAWLEDNGLVGLESFIDSTLSDGLPYSFGYVGLGLMWNESSISDLPYLRPYFYQWLKRFPGLMTPAPAAQVYPAQHGLVDIGWITFLGMEFATKLGGVNGILARIPGEFQNSIALRHLKNGGISIRAGNAPQLGDAENGDSIPLQRAVGHALREIWCGSGPECGQVVEGFPKDPAHTEEDLWSRRFFD